MNKPNAVVHVFAGFGTRKIQYAGGKEADWPLMGFSQRRQNLTLYTSLQADDADKMSALPALASTEVRTRTSAFPALGESCFQTELVFPASPSTAESVRQ